MALSAKEIFVNLPVKNLQKSIAFFKEVGFAFDENFTDEKAGCLIIGDNMYSMLITEERFKEFSKQEIPDTSKSIGVLIAFSADSRAAVDEIVNKAFEAGGRPANDAVDYGFMYSWSFKDLDGNIWEVLYMDQNQQTQN